MLNEETSTPTNPPFWRSFQKHLFDPHTNFKEAEARQEARLVSVIAFLFTLSGLVGAIGVTVRDGFKENGIILAGFTFVAFIAYILARTRFYKAGSYMIAWALVFVALGAVNGNRPSHSVITPLLLALLVSSVTFSVRSIALFMGIMLIAIGMIPFVFPGFTETAPVLNFYIPASLLTLAVTHHHRRMERDLFTRYTQLNQEFLSSKTELEQMLELQNMKLEKKTRQLQAVTQVAQSTASFQDVDRLLTSSTRLISDSFGFYHVGIFLLDEDGQLATLKATNSEAGQRMLDRMHTIQVDLNSIVGYSAKTHTPRIALDMSDDSVSFNNPDLPETRSELALPLKVGMRLMGVLDVQSTQPNAFSEEDIAILSTLGDQLAIAIDNTRLLTETRRALVTAEQTYQRYFTQAWAQFAPRLDIEGYRYNNGSVIPLDKRGENDRAEEDKHTNLRIPLMVRGQTIGFLDVHPTNNKQDWDTNEIAVLEATAERTALALESARLLKDAQRRAAKESIISEISSKISEESAIEKIMSSTVSELRRLLDASEVTLRINE